MTCSLFLYLCLLLRMLKRSKTELQFLSKILLRYMPNFMILQNKHIRNKISCIISIEFLIHSRWTIEYVALISKNFKKSIRILNPFSMDHIPLLEQLVPIPSIWTYQLNLAFTISLMSINWSCMSFLIMMRTLVSNPVDNSKDFQPPSLYVNKIPQWTSNVHRRS